MIGVALVAAAIGVAVFVVVDAFVQKSRRLDDDVAALLDREKREAW